MSLVKIKDTPFALDSFNLIESLAEHFCKKYNFNCFALEAFEHDEWLEVEKQEGKEVLVKVKAEGYDPYHDIYSDLKRTVVSEDSYDIDTFKAVRDIYKMRFSYAKI